jgi:hypothetical protein
MKNLLSIMTKNYQNNQHSERRCGCICIGRRKIYLSFVFAGQTIGIREVDDQIWLVSNKV